ncbi:KTSC domain-containing protein [Variovorax paradoxus]|uniref:KTSC domain-containing protein n=1 Tax=Variovorax paradoxus TaxID=34073 RepID=UPI0009B680CF
MPGVCLTASRDLTCGSGTVYQYPNVDAKLHADLLAADSIGTFFSRNINQRPFKKPAPLKAA